LTAGNPYFQKKVAKKEVVFYFFLLLFSLCVFASSISEPLKYLKYGLPVLLAVVLLASSKKINFRKSDFKYNPRYRYLIGLSSFYFLVCSVNLVKGFSNPRFYQEFYFVLSPLLFALLLFYLRPAKNYLRAVYLLFWGITAAFIAEKFPFFLDELRHPSILVDAFLTSELPTESNYAFEFGLFAIVFLERRNKTYSLLSLLFLLLSFKRIAIAAVFIYVVLALFRKLFGQSFNPANRKGLIFLTNCLVVGVLFLFFSGTFDEMIENTFGVSSNFLTQGRYNIYQDIFHHFGHIDFLGFGLGAINTFLSNTGYELVNLHSDVLKVFFELGPVAFVFWIYFFYKWSNSFLSTCLAIYINVLFLTDNVFIYFDVMFVFYITMIYGLENADAFVQKDVEQSPAL